MNFSEILEASIFLRPLNYLRVKSEYARRFNVYYPAIGAFLFYKVLVFDAESGGQVSIGSRLSDVRDLVALLIPFFVASLAAVSTFSGAKFLDEPFSGRQKITIHLLRTYGEWETVDLTPRNFLRLLFAFCTMSSFFSFAIISAADFIVELSTILGKTSSQIFETLFLSTICFSISHLFISTILAVYFLSDYLLRNETIGR